MSKPVFVYVITKGSKTTVRSTPVAKWDRTCTQVAVKLSPKTVRRLKRILEEMATCS